MKRFEKICGMAFLIGLVFWIADWPGGFILVSLSLTALAIFYYVFGFLFFNNIRLKNIFSQSSYAEISALRIIESIATGWGLSLACMTMLWTMMHWPGFYIFLIVAFIAILAVATNSLIQFFRSKNVFYKTILLRIAVIGGFGFFSFFSKYLI